MFKQYYTYFHTLFHPHVFPKNTNNVTRTTLPSTPLYILRNSKFNYLNIIQTYTKVKEIINSEKTEDTVQIHLFLSQ